MSGQSDRLKPVRTLSLCAAKCRGEFQRFARGLALLGEQRGTSAALLECGG